MLNGYEPQRQRIDPVFIWLELSVILLGVFSHFELIEMLPPLFSNERYSPSQWNMRWRGRRDRDDTWFSLKPINYAMAGLLLAAIAVLVNDTGGAIVSPFAPMLATVAVAGVAVSRTPRGVLIITVAVLAVTITLIDTATTHPQRVLFNNKTVDLLPASWVFAFVVSLSIGVAVMVALARLRNERIRSTIR